MMESAARSWRHRRRWLLLAALTLTAAALAAIAITTQSRSNRGLPIFLVLAHPTIGAGGSDTVVVLNNSNYRLNTGGAAMSPRTTTGFSLGGHAVTWDDPRNGVAPHSRKRILEPSWPTYPPGKYWVWMAYEAGSSDATRYAHTKLTILAR
jgi:hypothetical protein